MVDIYILILQHFRLSFLYVGHTHEDIDAAFQKTFFPIRSPHAWRHRRNIFRRLSFLYEDHNHEDIDATFSEDSTSYLLVTSMKI